MEAHAPTRATAVSDHAVAVTDHMSPAQFESWKALTRAHARLLGGVERALSEHDLPPLAWLDVLNALDESPDQTLRPRELGCGMTISRSGLTRLLDRMEAAGVVERRACEEDRRGAYVALTEGGAETSEKMREAVEAELAESFGSLLSDEQARELSALIGRLVETVD